MYYSIPEITDSLQNLGDKASSGTNIDNIISIPGFDSQSNECEGLLPSSIVKTDSSGVQYLPNTTNLNSQLDSTLSNLTPTINNVAYSALKSTAGEININTVAATQQTQVGGNSQTLLSISQDAFTNTTNQLKQVITTQIFSSQYGALDNAINNSIQTNTNLTPKGVRDLNTESVFNEKLNKTVIDAKSNLKSTSITMASNSVNNTQISNSAQNKLQQLSSPQFSGDNDQGYNLYVRRTVYWANGPGTDYDSAALVSATGRRLEQGISAAVDPSIIPYLSKIQFPDIGIRYATDTGGAVKARTASGGSVPVVDIFFKNRNDALAFANSTSEYITVKVYPPKTTYKYAANSSPTYGVA